MFWGEGTPILQTGLKHSVFKGRLRTQQNLIIASRFLSAVKTLGQLDVLHERRPMPSRGTAPIVPVLSILLLDHGFANFGCLHLRPGVSQFMVAGM